MTVDRSHEVHCGDETGVRGARHRPDAQRVLDVGCRQGVASILFAREGHEVVGIDSEPAMLEAALAARAEEQPAIRARLDFLQADATPLPFDDERFDVVLVGHLLERLADPRPVLAEVKRVLRPAGRLVATVTGCAYPARRDPVRTASALEWLRDGFDVLQTEPVGSSVAMVAIRSAKSVSRTPSWSADAASPSSTADEASLAKVARLTERVAAAPEDPEVLLALARAQHAAKQLEDSRKTLEAVHRLRPDWAAAHWHGLALAGSAPAARDEFPKQLAKLGLLEALDVQALTRIVTQAKRAGAWASLLAVGERLLAIGERERGVFAVATAHWEMGGEARAFAVAEENVEAFDAGSRLGSARFFAHIGEHLRAADVAATAPQATTALLVTIAQALVGQGEPRRGLDVIGTALARDPDHAPSLKIRGQALSSLRLLARSSSAPAPRRAAGERAVPGRVLHLVPRSMPHHQSGGTLRTHYTAKAQIVAGLEPHVVTGLNFPEGDSSRPYALLDGVPYYRLSDHRRPSRADEEIVLSAAQASDLVAQLRPSVLHPASSHVNALVAFELRERFGIPVVYEVRNLSPQSRARSPGSRVETDDFAHRRELEARCWHEADHLITLAEVMKRHIMASGIPAEKVTVVPNAVDSDSFVPMERDGALARAYGIVPDEVVIGYISTLNAYEGISYLIDAVALLREEGRRVKAIIVGDGKEGDRLAGQVRELGLEGIVTLTGRVSHDDVQRYYSLIDVFVVPRRDEPRCQLVTPLKPYEAMAMGRTVVVSGVAALREMIDEGETGLSFQPEDAGSLASTLRDLLEEPERRSRLAHQARQWVSEHRSWAVNAQRYQEVYAEMSAP